MSATTAYQRVTDALTRKLNWQPANEKAGWLCPAHEDSTASLSVSRGTRGAVLHCHAGCTTERILEAIGLTKADLFDQPAERANGKERAEIAATYDYVDETGDLLFQVVRMEPKTFRQRRRGPAGEWQWSVADTRRVLYRLPRVLEAVERGHTIYIVEGEKDVHAIEAAGGTATCNPGGAGKWRDEYSRQLAGATVVIVADNDAPGLQHAHQVEASLLTVRANARIVTARTGKDAADHLGAGHTLDDLVRYGEPEIDPSLQPIDLEPILNGNYTQPLPTQLFRTDGNNLFYAGFVNGIHGDSGTGKGWLVCLLIQQNAALGRRTTLLDFEDVETSITARLKALGMTDHEILTWVVYLRPQVPIDQTAVDHLANLVKDHNTSCVVVDSLGEAFSLEGINEDKDVEVGPWLRRVARPLADTGAAVVLVDHSTKAADNPLHPSGSKRKRAAIGGASYLVESIAPFVKGEGGRLRLTCAKDRHGNYRRGQTVADLVMDSRDNTVDLTLWSPSVTKTEVPVPTILAAKAATAAAKKAGRTVSRDELIGLMDIKAATDVKRGGIDYATAEGALAEAKGTRAARLYTYQNDLQESQ